MSEPFLGEVRIVGFNFPPRGWAQCDGQLLPISQNQSLYSLLGTTFGGDGRTSFGLPGLRGRTPMHFGNGPGLSERTQGQHAGTESVVLNQTQMPPHRHSITAIAGTADEDRVDSAAGIAANLDHEIFSAPAGAQETGNESLGSAGGNLAHNNMQPFLALNFVIALAGLFPSRN